MLEASGLAAVAIALTLYGQGAIAHVGVLEAAKTAAESAPGSRDFAGGYVLLAENDGSDANAHGYMVSATSAPAEAASQSVSLQASQLAVVPTNNSKGLLWTNDSGGLFPVSNGSGRYICTPSGFGQIATCTLRSAN
jgi:hypothetical protein